MLSLVPLAPVLDRKLSGSSPAERFRFFVLLMHGAGYKLGRENPFETDCSGTICWPLFYMGYNVRLRAAELFARLFPHHVDLAYVRDYWDHVYAVFYERAGLISHVTPITGRGVIFDAVEPAQPAQLKALEPVYNWYRAHGYSLYVREIDWTAARQAAEDPGNGWAENADELLKQLLGGI